MDGISPSSQAQTGSVPGQRVARPTIAAVISQHAEDSAALRHVRSVLVRAPHVKLHHLRRLDDRIAAHLDGLVVAGPDGWKLAVAALESPGPGEAFAAAVLAILDDNASALDKLLALAEAHPAGSRPKACAASPPACWRRAARFIDRSAWRPVQCIGSIPARRSMRR
jgi:hypothetical protein